MTARNTARPHTYEGQMGRIAALSFLAAILALLAVWSLVLAATFAAIAANSGWPP